MMQRIMCFIGFHKWGHVRLLTTRGPGAKIRWFCQACGRKP